MLPHLLAGGVEDLAVGQEDVHLSVLPDLDGLLRLFHLDCSLGMELFPYGNIIYIQLSFNDLCHISLYLYCKNWCQGLLFLRCKGSVFFDSAKLVTVRAQNLVG
jgi:hypothetical protein